MSGEKIIYEFQKNKTEKVVVSFLVFGGRRILNIRVFRRAKGDQENWFPTKKGLTLRRRLIPELKEAIEKAAQEYEKELPASAADEEEGGCPF